MANVTKHAFGARENIETAKTAGTLNAYDMLHLDNGEMGWLDKDGNLVMHNDRSQQAHTLNGTTLGSLQDGDTIPSGVTLDELLVMMTQKAIPATYTKPTVALANNGGQAAGNVEAGTSITPKLKATFTQNDAGALTIMSIKKGSDVVEVSTSGNSTLAYSGDAFTIGDTTVTYTAVAEYDDAPVKNNNLGKESKENWFAGGTATSSGYSITGKRNLFYGTGVGAVPTVNSDFVRGLSGKKLAPSQGHSWNINVAVGQQYIAFAYPATLRDVNQVMYVESNDTSFASKFTKTTVDVADARGGTNGLMSYKVYTYAMAVPAGAAMTLKVTI